MGRGWTVCELSLNNIVLGPWTQSNRQTLQMRLHFDFMCPSKARDEGYSTTLTAANHVDHVKTAVCRSTSSVSAECEIVGFRGVQLSDWNSSLATIFKKRASESSIDYRWVLVGICKNFDKLSRTCPRSFPFNFGSPAFCRRHITIIYVPQTISTTTIVCKQVAAAKHNLTHY